MLHANTNDLKVGFKYLSANYDNILLALTKIRSLETIFWEFCQRSDSICDTAYVDTTNHRLMCLEA